VNAPTKKPAYNHPDAIGIAIYNTALQFGMTKEEAQMICNVVQDIAKNGEQTTAPELLSQFY
jgi:hypothetical protein